MSILRFLLTLEANSWDEPTAAEVRHGPMVSLAKMILITSRLIITNKRIKFFLGGWSLKKVTVKHSKNATKIQAEEFKNLKKKSFTFILFFKYLDNPFS